MDKKTIITVALSVAITLGVSVSLQSLMAAWQSPTAVAPGGNVDEPLNTGSNAQSKTGVFTAQGGLVIENRTTAQGSPSGAANGRMWLVVP